MAEEITESASETTGQTEEQPIIIMECPLSYSFTDNQLVESAGGEAKGRLTGEELIITPAFGELLAFTYREILDLTGLDYRITLDLTSSEKMILFNLGYQFEDFFKKLTKARNEMLLKDLLMQETLKRPGVEAQVVFSDPSHPGRQPESCELRLYETAMVILPARGDLIRIPYSYLAKIQPEDYRLTLSTDFDETYTFSQMGREYDPFVKAFSQITGELNQKVQSSLKEIFPVAGASELRKVARLMKEGWAAGRNGIEAVSPSLWNVLEKKLESAGIGEEYNFLKVLAEPEQIAIGVKRGLLGDLTGEYIWFLVPISGSDPKSPGNAVAMESISTEGTGRATYFFRIAGRKDYPALSKEDFRAEVDQFIRNLNRCMFEINFRREPIYLPDEKLTDPQYVKYYFAAQKIPSLQLLRRLFIGRVIHSNPEQWKKDVMDLLEFNVTCGDDSARWQKSGMK
jgi:hypothetical protein